MFYLVTILVCAICIIFLGMVVIAFVIVPLVAVLYELYVKFMNLRLLDAFVDLSSRWTNFILRVLRLN